MPAPSGTADSFTINGLYLKFYLDLISESTKAFEKKDAELYYLHTYHLRSLITDKKYIGAIDAAIQRKREEFRTTLKKPDGSDLDSKTRQFLECFCIVENCMKFLDYTLKITKRDVEINADQSDEGMPHDIAPEVKELAEADAGAV